LFITKPSQEDESIYPQTQFLTSCYLMKTIYSHLFKEMGLVLRVLTGMRK